MPVRVAIHGRAITTAAKVERDLMWYDTVNHKMITAKGGAFKFVYDPAERRCKPQVVDVVSKVPCSTWPGIVGWVRSRSDVMEQISVIQNRTIVVDVDESQWGLIERELNQQKFAYQVLGTLTEEESQNEDLLQDNIS